MKISIDRLKELVTEEVTRISTIDEGEWRTGVPDEEVLAHGSDLEKYPTTMEEVISDAISIVFEDMYVKAGGEEVISDAISIVFEDMYVKAGGERDEIAAVDSELNEMAMEARDRIFELAGANNTEEIEVVDDEY